MKQKLPKAEIERLQAQFTPELLQRAINLRGMSYMEAGRELGVSHMAVWRWANGKSFPDRICLPRLIAWITSEDLDAIEEYLAMPVVSVEQDADPEPEVEIPGMWAALAAASLEDDVSAVMHLLVELHRSGKISVHAIARGVTKALPVILRDERG